MNPTAVENKTQDLDAITISNIRSSIQYMSLFGAWWSDYPTTLCYLLRRVGLSESMTGQEAVSAIEAALVQAESFAAAA